MALTDEQRATIARNKAEGLKRAAARIAREAAAASQASASGPQAKPLANAAPNMNPSTSGPQIKPLASAKPNANPPRSNIVQIPLNPVVKPAPIFTNTANTSSYFSNQKKPYQPTQTTSQPFKFSVTQARDPPPNAKPRIEVKLKIISTERCAVQFTPHHSAVMNIIKEAPSRGFDEKTKTWWVGIADVGRTTSALRKATAVDVHVEELPPMVQNVLMSSAKLSIPPADLALAIDPTLVSCLFPYQRHGVNFALERNGRVLIADEMGLGKSIQALAIARFYRSEWPLLIVCPASVKGAWKNQLNKFLPVVQRIFILDKGADPFPDVRTSNTVVIMSYDQMILKGQQLKEQKYRVVIFDESHLLKDGKAKRTRVATDLCKLALRVILLSGTPALSRPAELFTQIRLVDSKMFPNYRDFAVRYCDGREGRWGFEAKGSTNGDELAAVLFKKMMIRRLKVDVLQDLPEKRREVVYLTGEHINDRMDSLQKAKRVYDETFKSNTDSKKAHECLLEYFNLTGIVKAAAVCSHILDNFFYPDAPPRKVLIFAHHQIVLDTIQVEVSKRCLRAIRIDGRTPTRDRSSLCDAFQTNDEIRVAILSMTAAGVGITLTAASVVVFAEIHFNPGTLVQAEDRAHRVGQKDSVFVQYLIAKNTSDDVMWPMVQKKLDVLGKVSLTTDTFRDAEKSHMHFVDVTNQRRIDDFMGTGAPASTTSTSKADGGDDDVQIVDNKDDFDDDDDFGAPEMSSTSTADADADDDHSVRVVGYDDDFDNDDFMPAGASATTTTLKADDVHIVDDDFDVDDFTSPEKSSTSNADAEVDDDGDSFEDDDDELPAKRAKGST